jgi:dTMP kinase
MIGMTENYLKEKLGEENIIVTKTPTDLSRSTKLFQKMMYCKNHEDIDYRAVQLLTMSDRIQHTYDAIEPALRAGKLVICDRYIYTSLVNMLARGYKRERWFFESAKNLLKPDISFLAYVKPSLAIKRIKNRPEEARRHLDETQLKKVAAGFLAVKRQAEFNVLDTSDSSEKAFEKVVKILDRELSK